MSDDGIEIRVTSYSTACTDCVRLCFEGARTRPAGLLRAGVMHALALHGPDVPLCERCKSASSDGVYECVLPAGHEGDHDYVCQRDAPGFMIGCEVVVDQGGDG